jgi:transketolase
VYLRLGKAGEPNLTSDAVDPFSFGRVRRIRSGEGTCFLGYGPVLKLAFDAASRLEAATGERAAIVSVHTLKPLDRPGIAAILNGFARVVVIEEHTPIGGLGGQVKQIAWDSGARCELLTFSLQDEFIHAFGSHDDLRRAHGLSTDAIVDAVLGRSAAVSRPLV